jgi:hypothetical protein
MMFLLVRKGLSGTDYIITRIFASRDILPRKQASRQVSFTQDNLIGMSYSVHMRLEFSVIPILNVLE